LKSLPEAVTRAATALTHARENRFDHRDEPEHIGLELRAITLLIALLEGGKMAIPGIVDEHIDAAARSTSSTATLMSSAEVTSSFMARALAWPSTR
jgi:hypothetical protein